jgi:hypothetical protein
MVMFPRPLLTMAGGGGLRTDRRIRLRDDRVVLAGTVGYAVGRLVHRDTVRRVAGRG